MADSPSGGPTAEVPSTEPSQTQGSAESNGTGFLGGVMRSSSLLGDMWGLRPLLSKYGITFSLSDISEILGNLSGGVKRSFDYDGLTQMGLSLDTNAAFGLHGGTFNVSALQIHGEDLSQRNLLILQTASGIEADPSTRLWELWYQQKFLDEDQLDVKIGQQSLDQEFIDSQNAALFVNAMFGWPIVPTVDLPGGGPVYPLSAPGIRVRARPTNALTVLAGVFSGSPARNNTGDPQQQNPSGTTFPFNNGTLLIAEIQYAYPSPGTMVQAGEAQPLSGTYRLGAWYDSESFNDLRFDINGVPLASNSSTGIPETHRGEYGIYGIMDQMIWRSQEDDGKTLSFFARALGAPQEDRNLVDFSLNAGVTLHDPLPGRPDDTVGLGMGLAKVSEGASDADKDTGLFSGSFFPVRTTEEFLELTYQYQVTPWCTLQPDFQYVFNPGGGVLNPNSPGQTIQDEAVIGMRVTLVF